ncbi:hypothetical protein CC86DRAFT_132716, partial [Ophiobolus disseminans]
SRIRHGSFGQARLHEGSLSISPDTSPTTLSFIPPTSPPTASRSPPTLPTKRRRRPSNLQSTSAPDPVIGQVTLGGRFKCLDATCAELIFGRQADFRRHWDNVHASCRMEFFCSVDGCGRSKRPHNKSKGRSFGIREDKMREHVKTVHDKAKRKRDGDGEGDVKEEESSGLDDGDEKVGKKMRRDMYEGKVAWAGQGDY